MAWDVDDVVRSVRRYLSLTLAGPPWRIRAERRMVADDDRPVAVVDAGPQVPTRARESRHQGNTESVVPITVSAYPALNENEREAAHDARTLRARLFRLINNGLVVADADGRVWSGPYRLPLWDYVDVPLSGAEKGGPEAPHDVMFVERESVTCEAIQDEDDPKRWTVVLEFRVSIEAPGTVPTPEELGPPVSEFGPGTFVPS